MLTNSRMLHSRRKTSQPTWLRNLFTTLLSRKYVPPSATLSLLCLPAGVHLHATRDCLHLPRTLINLNFRSLAFLQEQAAAAKSGQTETAVGGISSGASAAQIQVIAYASALTYLSDAESPINSDAAHDH